ncbi:hypothetical protein LSAT2_007256 [Lamellibrachia satsuma]|nr:hypothetical protein LSAT2_007256 [Lamellibrachia satsuma]
MSKKDISAVVFAKLGSDSQLLNIRVVCVDNELETKELLRLYCVKSGYGNQVGDEPFVLYNNGKGIDVSLDELQACWHVNGKSKMTLSFKKVWCNSRPSCVFDVTPSGDLANYFKCVVRVAQQDGNEEDQAADIEIRYELRKESTDDVNTVNLLRECVDKMMEPRPNSRDSTHSFSEFIKPTTKEFVIPHKLKMELAILLDPIDILHKRDWRHLASIMGLDDMIPSLDRIGGQTELLLTALDYFNVTLDSITSVWRRKSNSQGAERATEFGKSLELTYSLRITVRQTATVNKLRSDSPWWKHPTGRQHKKHTPPSPPTCFNCGSIWPQPGGKHKCPARGVVWNGDNSELFNAYKRGSDGGAGTNNCGKPAGTQEKLNYSAIGDMRGLWRNILKETQFTATWRYKALMSAHQRRALYSQYGCPMCFPS